MASDSVDHRGAFTLIELLISLTVGAILLGIAASLTGPARDREAVRAAVAALGALHASARGRAAASGEVVTLHVETDGDSAWVASQGISLESAHFARLFGVTSEGPAVSLCLHPRGLAEPECGNVSEPTVITFRRGASTSEAELLPMGQLLVRRSPP